MMKCPGQDRSNWTGDPVREVLCPECAAAVEIFRDEVAGRCLRCGHKFLALQADFGCAQWCSVAKECLGFAPDQRSQPGFAGDALAAQLIQRLERECKNDPALLLMRCGSFILRRNCCDRREEIRAWFFAHRCCWPPGRVGPSARKALTRGKLISPARRISFVKWV